MKLFKGEEFKYIRINDIHTIHPRTPTAHISLNYHNQVLTEENKDCDAFFIAGDIFEKLADPSSLDYLLTIEMLANTIEYCYQNDIVLRVLEGTPLHDWKQPKVMEKLNNTREHKADLKYFDALDIEYIARFDKYVLYIPDEWCNDHDVLETQIEDKLKEHNIQQVDIAIMHGMFVYQTMGAPITSFCFEENYFLNLVKELIHIGHFHIKTQHDRIHAGPSFDRLKHGEEDPKGYHVITGMDCKFIENKDAYVYTTISVGKKETLKSLDRKIQKFPEKSYIRLEMPSDHPFNISFRDLVLRYYKYNMSKLIIDASESKPIANIVSDVESLISNFTSLSVNIKEVVYDNITSKNDLSDSAKKKLKAELEVFKNTESKEDE